MSALSLSIDFKNIIIEDMDFETLYSKMQAMIYERAMVFHRMSGIVVDDLASFGNEVFIKAIIAWATGTEQRISNNESIKKFSSFLYWRLTRQFTSYINKHRVYVPPADFDDAVEEYAPAFSDYWFEFNQIFLSQESKDLIRMLVKHEDYFIEKDDSFKNPKEKLFYFLKEKGFSYADARQCFNEIKMYLKELRLHFSEVSSVF